MVKAEALKREVQSLSPGELAVFRDWFLEFEWHSWEWQIEHDSKVGKLADLMRRIRRDHEKRKATAPEAFRTS